MDFSRKTPLRKAMIELEHQSRAGKNVLTQDHHAFSQPNNNTGSALGNQGSSAGSGMVPASPMGLEIELETMEKPEEAMSLHHQEQVYFRLGPL